jgi:hypothetical protein
LRKSLAKTRNPHPNDQENVQRAADLIDELVAMNPEIQPIFWVSASFSGIVNCFINSGISYERFCKEMNKMMEHYKQRWEDFGKL